MAEAAGFKTAAFCPVNAWKEKGLKTAPGGRPRR